jgi:predicted transcriptional regulator
MGRKMLSLKKIGESVKTLFNSQNSMKNSVEDMKEQVEDHLTSINENTNEIQSNYEYSMEVDEKINKLAERIDELSMLAGINKKQKKSEMPKLTTVEKQIFLALYTLCDEQEYVSYREIASIVNLSETLVMNYLTILIEKGVPIIKSYKDNETKIKLSSYFKNLQTKNNILKINQDITKQVILSSYIRER